MSAIIPFWKERLSARSPVELPFLVPSYFKARNDDTWCLRIARSQLYMNYQSWFRRYAKETYNTPYYINNPDKIPWYASEHTFFATIAPWLYVHGKEAMVRSYWVVERKQYEGQWLNVKVRRYFVRLATWDEHAAAFRRETGLLP